MVRKGRSYTQNFLKSYEAHTCEKKELNFDNMML